MYAGRWDRMREVWVGVACAVSGIAAMLLVNLVPALGHRIPQANLTRDYALGFFWALALWGVILVLWPAAPHDRRALSRVWLAKIFVALGAMLFYESRYGLDAYQYFAVPNRSTFVWTAFEFGAGTRNMMRLSWLQQQFIPNSYHALKVTCAFVGLFAVYLVYRGAVRFLQREDVRAFYVLALFPSILFWSSILGKDPIVLLGISLYVYGVIGLHTSQRAGRSGAAFLVPIVLGVAVAAFIRLWLAPILLAPLALLFVTSVRSIALRTLAVAAVLAAFVSSLEPLQQRFRIESQEDLVETTDRISRGWARGGSGQEVREFRGVGSIVAFAPAGAFTALFRPLPGEVLNAFGLLAGLENFFLLWLLFRAVRRSRWRRARQPLVLWALALIVLWSVVYGFVSSQNLGSAVRFKLQILPLLLGVLLYLNREEERTGPVGMEQESPA